VTEPVTVPELLRRTLDAQGFSQVDLAEQTGLSPKHINQILQGDIPLSPHCAWLIGYATGVPAEVWLTIQAVHTVWHITQEQPPRGAPIIPKLRRQRDTLRAEAGRLQSRLDSVKQLAVAAHRAAAFQVSLHPDNPELEYIEATCRQLLASLGVEPTVRLEGT